jgi:hypothetical protein
VIWVTFLVTSTFMLHRRLTDNQLLWKEMVDRLGYKNRYTNIGLGNPKCKIKWPQTHFQDVSLHDSLVFSASGREDFAVISEDPFHPRLRTPHCYHVKWEHPQPYLLWDVPLSRTTARRGLYIPPGLTLKNSTWCSHCVYVFCTDLRTNRNFCLIKH